MDGCSLLQLHPVPHQVNVQEHTGWTQPMTLVQPIEINHSQTQFIEPAMMFPTLG